MKHELQDVSAGEPNYICVLPNDGGVAGPPESGPRLPRQNTRRMVGLDVTKGALVLVMVLYHWMNYFIGLQSDFYRYLRFLTPSFIFVTGILISRVYLPRFARGERGVVQRLIVRGLKLLGIVVALNVLTNFAEKGLSTRFEASAGAFMKAYLSGSAPVAFSVLVPIGYLLVFCAFLLLISSRLVNIFPVFCCALVCVCQMCEWEGIPTGYLELLSIGTLGIIAGQIRIGPALRMFQHGGVILIVYLAYLWALAIWNSIYALQIIGVFINTALFCWFARLQPDRSASKRILIRLGEYSLFAYIAQILILQCLRHGAHLLTAGPVAAYGALLMGFAFTWWSVQAMHWAKDRAPFVRRVYLAVFA